MRSVGTWPAPLLSGETSEELVLRFDAGRTPRLLILPALFDEANKLRRLTVEVMHRLDLSGIDSLLPDLPGCNDSLAPLEQQTLDSWREAALAAADAFSATHCLTVRAGALLAPDVLPGWRYAPSGGRSQLRSMVRARTIAAREAGVEESTADLEAEARENGIVLAGWHFGPELFRALQDAARPAPSDNKADLSQEMVGGSGLWLRAEPDDDPEQADAIAAIIAIGLNEG